MAIFCLSLSILFIVIGLILMDKRYERKISKLQDEIIELKIENQKLLSEILDYFV